MVLSFSLVLFWVTAEGAIHASVEDTGLSYEDCLEEMNTSPTVGSARWVCEVEVD
jgi:hypothetical protein